MQISSVNKQVDFTEKLTRVLENRKDITIQKYPLEYKKGKYDFLCNVYCGPGHKEMTGTIIVN